MKDQSITVIGNLEAMKFTMRTSKAFFMFPVRRFASLGVVGNIKYYDWEWVHMGTLDAVISHILSKFGFPLNDAWIPAYDTFCNSTLPVCFPTPFTYVVFGGKKGNRPILNVKKALYCPFRDPSTCVSKDWAWKLIYLAFTGIIRVEEPITGSPIGRNVFGEAVSEFKLNDILQCAFATFAK